MISAGNRKKIINDKKETKNYLHFLYLIINTGKLQMKNRVWDEVVML